MCIVDKQGYLNSIICPCKSVHCGPYLHYHSQVKHVNGQLNWRNCYCIGTSYITYHWVCVNSNTMGVTCGAGPAYPVAESKFTPDFSCVRVTRSLVFCVMFYRSMFVFLWSLCCLSVGCSFWLHLWYDQSFLHRKRVDIFYVHAIHLSALSNPKELKYSLMQSVKLLACRLDSFSPS